MVLRAAATTPDTQVYVNTNGDRPPHVGPTGAASDLYVRIVRNAAGLRIDLRAAAVAPISRTGPGLDLDVVLDLTRGRRLDNKSVDADRNLIAVPIGLVPHHFIVVSLRHIGELLLVDDRPIERLHPPSGDERSLRNRALREVLSRNDELEANVHSQPVTGVTGRFITNRWRIAAALRCRHNTDQPNNQHSQQ